ncbi:MAG: smalltalk protein [Bacteroidaceae bacterium]|nr:smalltalk protein [Bacteroidaceae bacterium]MBP5322795.1 smalltalk protein [Bacteroidaceae bacterium]
MKKDIPWQQILKIAIAVLTAILGTLGVQSCL